MDKVHDVMSVKVCSLATRETIIELVKQVGNSSADDGAAPPDAPPQVVTTALKV